VGTLRPVGGGGILPFPFLCVPCYRRCFMFVIRPGESGPRVVLLQLLLNRKGATLVPDGLFGPKTKAALIQFQKSNPGLTPSGAIDPDTYKMLAEGTDFSVIDVVDVTDPMLAQTIPRWLKSAGSDPIELGGMCNGVAQMVQLVKSAVGGEGKMAMLRIQGHGNRGRWMTVSVGSPTHMSPQEYKETAGEYFSYIDDDHFDEVSGVLSTLKPYFAPYGSMEHGGCSLGSQPKTRHLMHRLADLWNVPVSAGITLQKSVFNIDGTPFIAYPKRGTLASWSKQFKDFKL
jgi:hypothetical protein